MTDAPVLPEKVVERPSPLTGLAHSGIILLGAVIMLTRELLDNGIDSLGRFGLIAGAVALLTALVAFVVGVLAWRTTTFIVDDDEFRVERRLVWSSSTRVDYTKVQSIEIEQPFVARLLGLAKVQIDVGGAGGVALSFLTKARAESLRETLLAKMRRVAVEPERPAGDPAHGAGRPWRPTSPRCWSTPFQSRPSSSARSSRHPRSWRCWAPASSAGWPSGVERRSSLRRAGWHRRLAVVEHHAPGVTMTRRGDTLRLKRGLASTPAQGLRPERIQGVAIHQDLLQRLTGLYRVRVTVLGYAESSADDSKTDTSTVLPFGTWDDVQRVVHNIWPTLDLREVVPVAQPKRARWLTPLSHGFHTWGVGPGFVVADHGLIEHTMTIVPHVRMQSLSLHQGPLQRRLRLASLALHTTDGPVSLRLYHLDPGAGSPDVRRSGHPRPRGPGRSRGMTAASAV